MQSPGRLPFQHPVTQHPPVAQHFPVAAHPPVAQARTGHLEAGTRARAGRSRLLIVEDDLGVRDCLHLILDDQYTVLEAHNGQTAIETVRTRSVDLVLLDLLIPDIDGIEILQELKTLRPELPVIVLTGVKTLRTAVTVMKLGACDYITKPFQEEELFASIRRALANYFVQAFPKGHRILLVDENIARRAALAVALGRLALVETATTLSDGIKRALTLVPTCAVLLADPLPGDAARFVRALRAELPSCITLVASNHPELDGTSTGGALWLETFVPSRPSLDDVMSRLVTLLRKGNDGATTPPHVTRPVFRAIDYLHAHLPEGLTVERLAAASGISGSHLAHLFRAETGMTVRAYLTRVRIEVAKDLLSTTNEKLASIAARVGFFDASHLVRVFRKVTGTSPNTYRRSLD